MFRVQGLGFRVYDSNLDEAVLLPGGAGAGGHDDRDFGERAGRGDDGGCVRERGACCRGWSLGLRDKGLGFGVWL